MAKVEIDVIANDRTGGLLSGVKGALGGILTTATGFLTAQVFSRIGQEVMDFAGDSINAASDLNEVLNKTNELFEGSADAIIQWSKDSALAVGLSQAAALDAASGFAIFGKGAGIAGQELNDFATENLQLAADMASFFNTSVEDAALAIQSAFRGETEPIRRYGVLLDDASLRAKALEMGIISSTKNALTPQQKILAANALIWEQTADAQGDFSRTSEGYANQQRIFNAQMENAKAALGEAFLPVLTEVMGFLNTQGIPILREVIDWVGGLVSAFRDTGDVLSSEFLESLTSFIPQEMQDKVFEFTNKLKTLFDFLSNWWQINSPGIIAAAQQLTAGLVTGFENIRAKVEPFITEVLGKLIVWFTENGPLIQSFAQAVADAFTNYIIPAVVGAVDVIIPLVRGIIDIVLEIAQLIMQVATGDWAGAWSSMQTIVDTALTAVWDAIVAAVDLILGFFGTSMSEGLAVWGQNWEMFKQIVMQVWDIIVGFVQEKIAAVAGAFGGIVDAIQGAIGWVQRLGDAFSGLSIPAWLTPGSPTPFEMGLRGINSAMSSLNSGSLPAFANNMQMGGVAAGAGAGMGGGGGSVVVNFTYAPAVSLGDREEAENTIAPIIAGVVRQMQLSGQLGVV